MDDFDDIIKKLRTSTIGKINGKTPDCPSEEEFDSLIASSVDKKTRERLIAHVVTCSYCAAFLKACMANKNDKAMAKELVKNIYPKSNDIDWSSIKELYLYSIDDKLTIPISINLDGIYKIEIKSPGAYAIRNENGQFLWSWAFEKGDLILTEDEAKNIKLAAQRKKKLLKSESLPQKLYDGRLIVEVVKGIRSGTLNITLNKPTSK